MVQRRLPKGPGATYVQGDDFELIGEGNMNQGLGLINGAHIFCYPALKLNLISSREALYESLLPFSRAIIMWRSCATPSTLNIYKVHVHLLK